ncbi:MAG: hypothetical protein RLZ55_988 [Actinomycetota bacterium]
MRTSAKGELVTAFIAAAAALPISGAPISGLTYEQALPGPTLKLSPGDVLKLTLTNNLPASSQGQGMANGMGQMNGMSAEPGHTNLHFHGLHVDPNGNSDNVFLDVAPGAVQDYEVRIPADHWGGLNWYHPHRHGTVTDQVLGGMAGAIIITGALDQVPQIAAAADQVLVLQRVQEQRSQLVMASTMHGNEFMSGMGNPSFTVNGMVGPGTTLRPGEVQRWRLVNADAIDYFDLALVDAAGQVISGGLHVIARDGIPLPAVRSVDSQLVVPGNRVELLVQAPAAAGAFALMGRAVQGFAHGDVPLVQVTVAGEPVTMTLPTTLPTPLESIPASAVQHRRTVTFGSWSNQMVVNGVSFQDGPDQVDLDVGSVTEWQVQNLSPEKHAFHFHTNPFMVVAVNGVPEADPWFWDTYPIPPATAADAPGSITIRTAAKDFRGKIVQHCHILPHEDAGMMGVINLV